MRAWMALPMAIVSLLSEPPRFSVRIMIDASRATPPVHALAIVALEHGLYDDSVIVAAAPPTMDQFRDSTLRDRPGIAVLRGRIAVNGDSAKVCLAVYDVLLRPMIGADSFSVAVAEFRDGLSAAGRRIARQLADRKFQPGPSTRPCL
jgi:hypothetical protein